MDVRVISFGESHRLVATLRRMFPTADVAVRRSVDVRSASVDGLMAAKMISHSAAHTLRIGRKWHHELGSKGGIGLLHAVRLAMETNTTRPLLVVEEDCIFRDEDAVKRDVAALLAHADAFDAAFFGALNQTSNPPITFLSSGWYRLENGPFFKTHCSFYTARARKNLVSHLRQPADMQLDALYSSLAHFGALRVLVQLERHTVVQSTHISSIQELSGTCRLCNMSPTALPVLPARLVGLVALVVMTAVAYRGGRCR